MEKELVTLELDEYLKLKKFKEDTERNQSYCIWYDWHGKMSSYYLVTKEEELKSIIIENHKLEQIVQELREKIKTMSVPKKKGWFR